MKLLFDKNLSPKLPHLLATLFPDSKHVRDCGLRGQPDEKVWKYFGAHGFTLVSNEVDFQQRGLFYGHPSKVIWLRIGNCTREQIVQLVTWHAQDIQTFEADSSETIEVLW